MRRLLLSDVIHLASALAVQARGARGALLDEWVDQTRAAAKYRRRFDRPHPLWGDGSLTSRALKARGCGTPGAEALTARSNDLSALALVADFLAGVGQSGRQGLS